ncbi:MAG: nucleotidyltransferase domain-containing protein [SAR202 cluster bacterium]|nr:nucleotidyltransferase domain-containing protein [SAR202 cluster bacterium]
MVSLCEQFAVRRLEIFGSATRDDFNPARSDVDLLVEFGYSDTLRALQQYFGLKDALEGVLGRPVDLVESTAVKNPYVRKSIDESREPLYAA